MSAYEATKGEIKFALFRSAAWAERAFESMRANENRMDAEQLRSLRAMLTSERDRMTRARMGATSPDASVWSEAMSWLDARIQERGQR
jgi:hypothetical protein